MDLKTQEAILKLAQERGAENVVVILGAPDPEAAEIAAETVVSGDPSYAGPLTEAQLGLSVYHVLDPAFAALVPEEVWEDQIGIMTDVLDVDELTSAVDSMAAAGS